MVQTIPEFTRALFNVLPWESNGSWNVIRSLDAALADRVPVLGFITARHWYSDGSHDWDADYDVACAVVLPDGTEIGGSRDMSGRVLGDHVAYLAERMGVPRDAFAVHSCELTHRTVIGDVHERIQYAIAHCSHETWMARPGGGTSILLEGREGTAVGANNKKIRSVFRVVNHPKCRIIEDQVAGSGPILASLHPPFVLARIRLDGIEYRDRNGARIIDQTPDHLVRLRGVIGERFRKLFDAISGAIAMGAPATLARLQFPQDAIREMLQLGYGNSLAWVQDAQRRIINGALTALHGSPELPIDVLRITERTHAGHDLVYDDCNYGDPADSDRRDLLSYHIAPQLLLNPRRIILWEPQ